MKKLIITIYVGRPNTSDLHKIIDMFSEGFTMGIDQPEGINWEIEIEEQEEQVVLPQELHDQMNSVIKDMQNRSRCNQSQTDRHYGFVWGILWIAARLGFKDMEEEASKAMKDIATTFHGEDQSYNP